MKVTILGATSQSTPSLFRAMPDSTALSQMHFSLVARNAGRLAAITRAIGMTVDQAIDAQCHDLSPEGLSRALDGADVVLIQVRYGGLAGRDFDERFPLAFETCGDEGLGAGGLSSAWRNWPALSEHLGFVSQVCPSARVLLLTGPSGLLARLSSITFPDLEVRALCELPMTTLLESGAGAMPRADSYDYFGVNHLGWIYGLEGRAPIPLKYWRLHTATEQVLAEQRRRAESRAAELERLSGAALSTFATGTREQILAALQARPSPWYAQALAPLLSSFVTGTSSHHFFFSEMNDGWHGEFQASDVLEIPYYWSHGQLVRKPQQMKPADEIVAGIRPFVEYERLAATAVLSRDQTLVERALEVHPWVVGRARAAGLATAIVSQPLPPMDAA
jgi:alpha-galactosidase/6-phospho-beta-glucosidase family protein